MLFILAMTSRKTDEHTLNCPIEDFAHIAQHAFLVKAKVNTITVSALQGHVGQKGILFSHIQAHATLLL